MKTVGINENEEEDYFEIAEPVGIIAGITPVTNPTSTTLFKCIIAMKTRNPIIFAFIPVHSNAVQRLPELYEMRLLKQEPRNTVFNG